MVIKELRAKGRSQREAEVKLRQAASAAGAQDLDATVMYEVTVTGKSGRKGTGKPSQDYAAAFASGLDSAKVKPNDYLANPQQYQLEVSANGAFAVSDPAGPAYRSPATGGQPAGAAPSEHTSRKLTDLF